MIASFKYPFDARAHTKYSEVSPPRVCTTRKQIGVEGEGMLVCACSRRSPLKQGTSLHGPLVTLVMHALRLHIEMTNLKMM